MYSNADGTKLHTDLFSGPARSRDLTSFKLQRFVEPFQPPRRARHALLQPLRAAPPLVAASVAALTIYDMCKALERGMEITELYLASKSGGRSGSFVRSGKRAKP